MFYRTARKLIWGSVLLLVFVMTMLGCLMIYARSQQALVLSVQTGSMEPAIKAGEAVVVQPYAASAPAVGQVVSYRSVDNPNVIITHRIMSIDTQTASFIAKGDGAATMDEPASLTRIVGRVEASIPFAGLALDAVRQPIGLAVAVYVPAISIAVTEVQRLSRYYATRRYNLYGYRRYRYPPIPSRISYS